LKNFTQLIEAIAKLLNAIYRIEKLK